MAGRRVGGTSYVKVDGVQLSVTGGHEVPLTDKEREGVATSAGNYYTEKDGLPYVNVEAVLPPGFPIKKIMEGDSMTITSELANGMTYVLSGAWLKNRAAYNAEDGKVKFEFEGANGKWL
ncbi:phage tail protein [Chromobacterium haemolyticum]|uniref:phage tail tube protein n=1 Tax=Chromobacterium haemolyticum TaxID=394935 RepID=UPI0009DADCE2|nr:phage tail tube protein [Chromobacterium haemolyticum]OQS36677.1 phage tail protein [Chromobacterium haemolyticum]